MTDYRTSILGIDPGTRHIGLCLYDPSERRVLDAITLDAPGATVWNPVSACAAVRDWLCALPPVPGPLLVALELTEARYGQHVAGADIQETAQIVGALWRDWHYPLARRVVPLRRREVLRALRANSGAAAVVRGVLMEMHGGSGATTTRKRCPSKRRHGTCQKCGCLCDTEGHRIIRGGGPLAGVSGHAWDALAVAVAALLVEEAR